MTSTKKRYLTCILKQIEAYPLPNIICLKDIFSKTSTTDCYWKIFSPRSGFAEHFLRDLGLNTSGISIWLLILFALLFWSFQIDLFRLVFIKNTLPKKNNCMFQSTRAWRALILSVGLLVIRCSSVCWETWCVFWKISKTSTNRWFSCFWQLTSSRLRWLGKYFADQVENRVLYLAEIKPFVNSLSLIYISLSY